MLLLLLAMLMACASGIQDLTGQMFTFPAPSSTAYANLMTNKRDFGAVTLCHRTFTDLRREHVLFSMSTSSHDNAYLVFWDQQNSEVTLYVKNVKVTFGSLDYKPNMWHSICTTWDSESGLVQLWFNGKPSIRKFSVAATKISGATITLLGQEQDNHGGGFSEKQCFVGMVSDVHMWNYVLSQCEIQKYMNEESFIPGNVFNWEQMDFSTNRKVVVEEKHGTCH